MKISGKVWKYGDDVNTDLIFPGRYTYTIRDEQQMGEHALEDLDKEFAENVCPGDIIVAGKNWGCGSSRQQAVTCLRMKGVGAIIAKGFARIYYRNAVNEALPVIICPEAVDFIERDDKILIDFGNGLIHAPRRDFKFSPLPPNIQEIISSGGLISFINRKMNSNEQNIK